ncbi:hypothetical protein SMCF_1913 [Streptomyces coelicoflavus ZG0656]|nr:hypothetical protein SMCF_1913 [Streptomyces coelicoflavus ZG0656]
MSHSTQPGRWDGPWYRVRTERFEAAFLPNSGEDMEAVDNIDVLVDLKDGSRWSATVITLGQVEAIMARWAESGEASGGRYFRCSDGLIVRDPGISNMTQVLTGLIESDEFTQILHRLDCQPGKADRALERDQPPAAAPSTSGGQ